MNVKNVIGFICMLVLTILGVIFICSLSLLLEINSNGIMKAANKTDYLEICENDVKDILLNYMPEDKVDIVLDKIDVRTDIIGLINAFDSNKAEWVASDIKEDMKNEVLLVLDDGSDEETKQEFANVVAKAYISEIFPVSEFDMISNYYTKYASYLSLAIVIIAIISTILCICLIMFKKNRNFLIISLYNIIIFSVIIAILISSFNNIVIGNEKTTDIIVSIINSIRNDIYISAIIIAITAIVLNYVFYFRKSKSRKN